MAVPSGATGVVHLSLSAQGKSSSEIPFPDRHITLDEENPSVIIGRASKVSSKGFLPDEDNGWFDSAVMSRRHAEIRADLTTKKVRIQDLGSLHGTYLNNQPHKLPCDVSRDLQPGDTIRFGVGIERCGENFAPATVQVGIVFDQRCERSSSTFRVPEGSDNESDIDNFPSDDELPEGNFEPAIMGGMKKTETIDLTGVDSYYGPGLRSFMSRNARHHDARPRDIIDLSTSPPPKSPVLVQDDDDISEKDSIVEVPTKTEKRPPSSNDSASGSDRYDSDSNSEQDYPDDDENHEQLNDYPIEHDSRFDLHGGDDESDLYASDDAFDMDVDHSSSGSAASSRAASPDMNDEQVSESDDFEEYSDVDGELDDKSDDDENMDEIPEAIFDDEEPADPVFNLTPSGKAACRRLKVRPIIQESLMYSGISRPSGRVMPIESLLNKNRTPQRFNLDYMPPSSQDPAVFNFSCEPEASASVSRREPSPSDVAMFMRNKQADAPPTSAFALSLGLKTGKYEYFAAREQNRMALRAAAEMHVEQPRQTQASTEFVSYQPEAITLLGHAGVGQPASVPHPSSTAAVEPNAAADILAQEDVCAYDTSEQANSNAFSETTRLGAEVPPQQDQPLKLPAQQTKIPSGAKILSEKVKALAEAEGARRTRLGVADIIDGFPKTVDVSKVDKSKGKRKADEISTLSDKEKGWSLRPLTPVTREPMQIPSPSPSPISEMVATEVPVTAVPPTPMLVDKVVVENPITSVTAEATMSAADTEGRAPKRQRLRKMAERAGYAALGGVTAGAMILGTLIYTAPTF